MDGDRCTLALSQIMAEMPFDAATSEMVRKAVAEGRYDQLSGPPRGAMGLCKRAHVTRGV